MNESQASPNNLLDTTDCLEAVGVFKGWKNFLFVIVLLCLLLLQASFLLVDTGYIKIDEQAVGGEPAVTSVLTDLDQDDAEAVSEEVQEITEPVQELTAEEKRPIEAVEPEEVAEPEEAVEPEEVTEPEEAVEPEEPSPKKPLSRKRLLSPRKLPSLKKPPNRTKLPSQISLPKRWPKQRVLIFSVPP